jgi:pimeloyl-ACP methyl ester carboxylesterase
MSTGASGPRRPSGLRRQGAGAAVKLSCFAVALVTFATTTATATAAIARPIVRATASKPAVPQLDWVDCDGGFDCATATVPLDYDQPQGATIKLRLARLPATDPSRRIGSLFLNPGGPGGSGVDMVRDLGPFLFSKEVRARFDLVGFDPRGIMRSTALRCFNSRDEAEGVLTGLAFPFTRAEERATEQSDRLLADACRKHGGAILNHMSAANVARDMDLLRQAVGDAKLNYYGISYGSYLGETYANLFPGNVGALIIDAVPNPVEWSTGRGNEARTLPAFNRLDSPDASNTALEQFFELCDQGGENCPLSGDAEGRYRNLTRALLQNPLQLPDGGVITYADVVSFTLDALYQPPVYPFLAKILVKIEKHIEPATIADDVRELRARLSDDADASYRNFVEGQPGVICSETDNPSTADAWATAGRAADREFGYFGRIWTWTTSQCAVWPGKDHDRFTGPFNHQTANPVLVIGNRYDPVTKLDAAAAVANMMPGAGLLMLDGWGHTSLLLSACINKNMSHYLLTNRLPPKGTVCEPDVIPFQQPADAGTSQTAVLSQNIARVISGA